MTIHDDDVHKHVPQVGLNAADRTCGLTMFLVFLCEGTRKMSLQHKNMCVHAYNYVCACEHA